MMQLISEFKKFAMRGSLIDLAVGFTVGAAFTTIAQSLVNDIIMPPVGLALGNSDFSDLFVILKAGKDNAESYTTLAEAQSAGAVTLNYGLFFNSVFTFLLITLAMFVVIRVISQVEEALEERLGSTKAIPEDPPNKKCPFCRSTIAFRALRCPCCTSHLEASSPAEQR